MSIENQTVTETVAAIKDGSVNCKDVVTHYGDIINKNEASVGAWEHYDQAVALKQATELDNARKNNQTNGEKDTALQGIPVGLKDIFDTVDFHTEYGSPIHKGRQPESDCLVVEKLKEAGAVIMGKTVTTEFAFFNPSRTCNPHNTNYSPGGSSSGSAAAVAAGQVPLSIGTQTNGSVIRPASFCGVYGFKPSRGLVSRRGILETSTTLDHVGVFARSIEDIAALTDVIAGYDEQDSASYREPRASLRQHLQKDQQKEPSLVWIDMPYSDRYSKAANAAFEKLLADLHGSITRIEAPASFSNYLDAHKAIYDYEIVRALDDEINNHWSSISATARPIFEASQTRTKDEYIEAIKNRESAIEWFNDFFQQYDAILTPSAVASAPLMGSTGDPVCCTIWTLCGLPCVTLPLLKGDNDLPLGVQLVGPLKEDHHLMSTATHLIKTLGVS